MQYYFFRPEKEGYNLMRAALPHLKLLTLPMDQISLLTKYLLPEEKVYLSKQVFLKEEDVSAEAPPCLNTDKVPRTSVYQNPNPFELFSKEYIITDHSKMSNQDLCTIRGNGPTKFRCDITPSKDFFLKAVEILTRATNFTHFKNSTDRKIARYTILF